MAASPGTRPSGVTLCSCAHEVGGGPTSHQQKPQGLPGLLASGGEVEGVLPAGSGLSRCQSQLTPGCKAPGIRQALGEQVASHSSLSLPPPDTEQQRPRAPAPHTPGSLRTAASLPKQGCWGTVALPAWQPPASCPRLTPRSCTRD